MNLDSILEFDQIRKKWSTHALTKSAVERIDTITYELDESTLQKHLLDTTHARDMIRSCGTPPLVSMEQAEEILGRAVKEGCLTPDQLETIGQLLTAVRRLIDYLNKGKAYDHPLAWYEQNLDACNALRDEIALQIRNGQVDDHASKQLSRVRAELVRIKEKMIQKAEQVMRAQKECMADQFYTVRCGHICIPVKKDYKWKVKGSVIDQSSKGSTLFIEPAAVGNMQESTQALELEEMQEVSRILYTLTAMVADHAPVILENIRTMEKLDFIFSKGKLSLEMNASEPRIHTDRKIRLKNARHPLMDQAACVPLQFEIGESADGIVITGPNTGGKTVAMKTIALNCYMAQCGLHVTCEEADICMNSSILCDIGDGQNLTENLSTFSAHIKNVLEIIGQVTPESLVVMDELGSGTDPAEGMGIAVSILEELRRSGCLFLVTTHYPEVKEYADHAERIQNARMEFDRWTLRPTYRMVIGEAGESCAFYIAQKLGMPQRMLETAARAAYGEGAGLTVPADSDSQQTAAKASPDIKEIRKIKKIKKVKKTAHAAKLSEKFRIGDSVMVFPDKKIGIVCTPVNEKGVLQIQMPDKKIYINQKRVKLHVAAAELYPDDYDFSILFDTVQNRKIRHEMSRKYTTKTIEKNVDA